MSKSFEDAMRKRRERERAWPTLLARWRDIPEGTPVTVKRDDGSKLETVTRSAPWTLGHGQPVISLEGIVGGYMLERVTLRKATP
jgi:hypothetical protein